MYHTTEKVIMKAMSKYSTCLIFGGFRTHFLRHQMEAKMIEARVHSEGHVEEPQVVNISAARHSGLSQMILLYVDVNPQHILFLRTPSTYNDQ